MECDTKRIVAVLPAAEHPDDPSIVVSHPGSSFGGLVMSRLDVSEHAELFALAMSHFRSLGYAVLRCKTTPSFVGDVFNDLGTHHGLQFGQVVRADLWNAIQLDAEVKVSPTRRSDIKGALRKGVTPRFAVTNADWQTFYQLLVANLRDRHGAVPVHSAAELIDLHGRLGQASQLLLAEDAAAEIVAGTWLIDYGHRVLHTQYICSSVAGRSLHAVDAMLGYAIDHAKSDGYKIFSFGTNTMPDGWSVNVDLMKYKLRFGSGVVVHPTFDYRLDES